MLTVVVPVVVIAMHYPYGQTTKSVMLERKSSGEPVDVWCLGNEGIAFRMLHITRDQGPRGFDLRSELEETKFIK